MRQRWPAAVGGAGTNGHCKQEDIDAPVVYLSPYLGLKAEAIGVLVGLCEFRDILWVHDLDVRPGPLERHSSRQTVQLNVIQGTLLDRSKHRELSASITHHRRDSARPAGDTHKQDKEDEEYGTSCL